MKYTSSEASGTITTEKTPDRGALSAEASADDGSINILLVDDEPRNLTVLESVLEGSGYRLVRAASAEDALLALVLEEFALLIIDIQMPGMTGFELAQMIKQRKKTADVPIIFLTAYYNEDRYVLEGYGSGAVDYLHKPINPAILRSKVAVFAELYRKNRESAQANHALMEEITVRRRAEEQLRQLNDELEQRVAERTAELVRSNAALSASEQRLRLALQAGRTGVWFWEFATARLTWSEESHDIHALELESSQSTLDAFKQLVHADDRDRLDRALDAAMHGTDALASEFRIVRGDGSVRWVTILGLVQVDSTGQPASITGTITDITERRTAQQALQQRERELRTLADSSPDVLIRFDRELRSVFLNSAFEKATGQPRDRLLHRTMRAAGMPAELCDAWEPAIRSVFATREPRSFEFAYQGPSGQRLYATRLVPECNAAGAIELVLSVTQDVTERKRAEEALQHADRRKDEFLATLAHELRNPLAPIRTGLHLLKATQDRAMNARTQEMMERQLSHMVRLIDDLLDVSRITTGKVNIQKELVTLQAVADTALEAARPMIEAAGHRLSTTLPREPVWLLADPTRLSQVITNLLTNAAKYTPQNGSIEVVAGCENAEVWIQVRDTGLGIPPLMLDEVFEMFTQINRTLDRSQGGLGIGLALVKRLIEIHGGSITAESPGLGKGSTFTLRLPIAETASPSVQSAAGPSAEALDPCIPARRVLVVDDNVDGANSLSAMLQIRGHEVRTANSGLEALELARPFLPDVVFLDIGLPGMNGYEVAKRMREELALRETVLVALTGWGSEDDKRESKQAGLDFHLTKPVDITAIDSVLARAGRLKG